MLGLFVVTMVVTVPLAWLLHRFTRVRTADLSSTGTTTGATNSSSIARSSASSRPGKISSEVITRTSQRPRRWRVGGVIGAERLHERRGQRLDHVGLLGHLAADRRLAAVANHD